MVKTQLLQANFFMVFLLLSLAFAAQTGEGQLAGVHLAAGAAGTQLRGNGDLVHIHHRVAAIADKMNVGLGVGIEALGAVDGGNAGDLSLFLE